MIKKGLGKGLGALIPTYDTYDEDFNDVVRESKQEKTTIKSQIYANGIVELDVSLIDTNPNQPRKKFDEGALQELASSIRAHGILQPIIVVKSDDRYMIVAGERRYRASILAGKETITAIIKNYSNKEIKELALIENLQREDLNPIEVARGFKELLTEYGFTQDLLAERLGMQRSSVANYLRLLALSKLVLDLVEKGDLSFGHAKVLAGIEDKSFQEQLAKIVIQKQLNVRKLEDLIKELLENNNKKTNKQKIVFTPELKDLIKKMQDSFGTKVTCLGTENKGRISIEYYSRDDLDRIYEVLRNHN